MNTLKRIVSKRLVKRSITADTREKIYNGFTILYLTNIVGFTLFGVGYGFYESIQNCGHKEDKFSKITTITGDSIMMGGFGFIIGLASPIILPIMIPAYAYITYTERIEHREHKKE